MLQSLNFCSTLASLGLLVLLLSVWEWSNQPPEATKALTEYEMLMGGADPEAPPPLM